MLERELGVPFVTIGRGGVSPTTYIKYEQLTRPLLSNAKTVIIMIMNGHTSPSKQISKEVHVVVCLLSSGAAHVFPSKCNEKYLEVFEYSTNNARGRDSC